MAKKKEIEKIENVGQFKTDIVETIDQMNDGLEDHYDNDIDFIGELKSLKDYIDDRLAVLRNEIETKSNSPFRHGEKWTIEWSEKSGSTTIDKAAMKEALGEDIFSKYEKIGKPSKMIKYKPLIDEGSSDESDEE